MKTLRDEGRKTERLVCYEGGDFDGLHRRTLRLFETTKARRHPLRRIRFPGNHLLLLEAIARHNGQVIHPLRLLARETTTARGCPPVFSVASARFPRYRHRRKQTHTHRQAAYTFGAVPFRRCVYARRVLPARRDVLRRRSYCRAVLLCAARLFPLYAR